MNKRQIKHIFVHCTATLPTASVESLRAGWKAIGWKNPGYHYVVKPSGEVVSLQPEDKASNGVKGYNAHAIHVAYIGGLRMLNGTKIYEDTRTLEQMAGLRQILRELRGRYPKAIILGHRSIWGEYTPEKWQKLCPCFNAIKAYADI